LRLLKTTIRSRIVRWEHPSAPKRGMDELAVEEPLEIRVDTRPVSVTMRTPGHDAELVAGFLLSEGLVGGRADVARIEPYPRNAAGNVLNVFLAPSVPVNWERLTRHVFVSSSCGLCGQSTIDAVHRHFRPLTTRLQVPTRTLLGLPDQLGRTQAAFARTGGLHAAAVFDAAGRLVVAREDIGRHNAVDKALGHGLLNGLLPFRRHILLVSGRASFEIVQKALAARIPIVCAVSAPSSLAVRFAQTSGQTLVGFLRGQRLNVYSRPERIRV
jgi:FdhD protein